jgi:hypothetical protein
MLDPYGPSSDTPEDDAYEQQRQAGWDEEHEMTMQDGYYKSIPISDEIYKEDKDYFA